MHCDWPIKVKRFSDNDFTNKSLRPLDLWPWIDLDRSFMKGASYPASCRCLGRREPLPFFPSICFISRNFLEIAAKAAKNDHSVLSDIIAKVYILH